MEINLHFHEVVNQSMSDKIDRLILLVEQVIKKEIYMSQELDALTAEVTEIKTAVESAKVAFTGLAAQIEALKQDPIALQTLADSLKATSMELAEAVANVPV